MVWPRTRILNRTFGCPVEMKLLSASTRMEREAFRCLLEIEPLGAQLVDDTVDEAFGCLLDRAFGCSQILMDEQFGLGSRGGRGTLNSPELLT